jgi:hypothetical protein
VLKPAAVSRIAPRHTNTEDTMDDKTTEAARQIQPAATPLETGISSNVLRELDAKAPPEHAARIRAHLAKKG